MQKCYECVTCRRRFNTRTDNIHIEHFSRNWTTVKTEYTIRVPAARLFRAFSPTTDVIFSESARSRTHFVVFGFMSVHVYGWTYYTFFYHLLHVCMKAGRTNAATEWNKHNSMTMWMLMCQCVYVSIRMCNGKKNDLLLNETENLVEKGSDYHWLIELMCIEVIFVPLQHSPSSSV